MSKLKKKLKKLQKEEKRKANHPSEKVIEEAAEVIMAHLGSGDLAEEKMDLLMSLMAWCTKTDLENWRKKMNKRGRIPVHNQQRLLNMFGVE